MALDCQTASAMLRKSQDSSISEKAKLLQQHCALSALLKSPTMADLESAVQDILQAVAAVRKDEWTVAEQS